MIPKATKLDHVRENRAAADLRLGEEDRRGARPRLSAAGLAYAARHAVSCAAHPRSGSARSRAALSSSTRPGTRRANNRVECDERSDDLSRQQELRLMVAAGVAGAEAHRGRVRGDRNPAVSARQPADRHAILAVRAGAGAAARRSDDLGQSRDLRISGRTLSRRGAVARRSAGACRGARGQRRDACRVRGAAAAKCR